MLLLLQLLLLLPLLLLLLLLLLLPLLLLRAIKKKYFRLNSDLVRQFCKHQIQYLQKSQSYGLTMASSSINFLKHLVHNNC